MYGLAGEITSVMVVGLVRLSKEVAIEGFFSGGMTLFALGTKATTLAAVITPSAVWSSTAGGVSPLFVCLFEIVSGMFYLSTIL